jgi:hypothetical protein
MFTYLNGKHFIAYIDINSTVKQDKILLIWHNIIEQIVKVNLTHVRPKTKRKF